MSRLTSSNRPPARRAAIGSGGCTRPARTTVDPGVRCSASAPTASAASPGRSRSALSSTRTTGCAIVLSIDPIRGTAAVQTDGAGDRSASTTIGSMGLIWPVAAAMWVSRTVGSLSRSSIETHANGRGSRLAHWLRSVVFPKPAGATTVTSGTDEAPRRRFTRAVRTTLPVRGTGIWILASTKSSRGSGGSGASPRRAGRLGRGRYADSSRPGDRDVTPRLYRPHRDAPLNPFDHRVSSGRPGGGNDVRTSIVLDRPGARTTTGLRSAPSRRCVEREQHRTQAGPGHHPNRTIGRGPRHPLRRLGPRWCSRRPFRADDDREIVRMG